MGALGLNTQHVMEPQWVAQIKHQAQQVNEQQDKGDRIRGLRDSSETLRRHQLAERRNQK